MDRRITVKRPTLSRSLPVFRQGCFRTVIKLGEGSFSHVHKCSVVDDCDIDKDHVAMKVLKNSSGNDLVREANNHGCLKHENIVKIFGVVPTSSGIGIVMELIDGGTLRGVLNRPRYISAKRARDYSRQLADGIDYLHNQAKMVHGDLKPENVLLTKRKEVKITDFGVAAHVPGSRVPSSVQGTVHLHGGTKSYLAPEFRSGMLANPAIDMYSFGVIMTELMEKFDPDQEHTDATRRVTKASNLCRCPDLRLRATSTRVLEVVSN